jgi:glycosyltransferase involved in cell wall biosynthesis
MACGVVPVATRAGGLPEVVRDGVDGVLVPEAEIARMGARVVDLLRDPARLAAMGAAAAASARERFSPDQVVPRYEALYARAMAGSAR